MFKVHLHFLFFLVLHAFVASTFVQISIPIPFSSRRFNLQKGQLISFNPNVFSLDPINTSYNTPTSVRHIMSWINNENSWRRWYKFVKYARLQLRIVPVAVIHFSSSMFNDRFNDKSFNIILSICRSREERIEKYNIYVGNFFLVSSVKKIYLTIVLD